MSGPDIERENILDDVLSADSRSKSAEGGCEYAREHSWRPEADGLYDPSLERDSCGVGFIAHIKGVRSHSIVRDAAEALRNMDHRGACGCEANTGDGAGVLTAIPDELMRSEAKRLFDVELPEIGRYAIGQVFLPRDEKGERQRDRCDQKRRDEPGPRRTRRVRQTAGDARERRGRGGEQEGLRPQERQPEGVERSEGRAPSEGRQDRRPEHEEVDQPEGRKEAGSPEHGLDRRDRIAVQDGNLFSSQTSTSSGW